MKNSAKNTAPKTNVYNLAAGTEIYFFAGESSEYNGNFKLAKVTETRVSWYTGHVSKGGQGKNELRMASTSLQLFNKGIENGAYTIVKK